MKRLLTRPMAYIWPIGILGGLAALYFGYIRTQVNLAYEGSADLWLQELIQKLYPRFEVEKHRFDITFFLHKADQLVYRGMLLALSLVLLDYLLHFKQNIRQSIKNFWNQQTSSTNVNSLRLILYTYMIYLGLDLYWEVLYISPASAFYKPVPLLKLLRLPFPAPVGIHIIGISLLGCLFLTLVGLRAYVFAGLSALLFLILQCYYFSFEKIDHGYATINLFLFLFPLVLYEKQKASPSNHIPSWALQLIIVLICLVYTLTGLEKVLTSFDSWITPDNFRHHLYHHPTELGMRVAQSDLLCTLFPLSALLVQLSFGAAIFIKPIRYWSIIGGILFHTGTLILLGIGHPLNPWIIVYCCFIDWSFLKKYFPFLSRI